MLVLNRGRAMNGSYYATVLLQELLGQPSLLCMVTLMLC